MKKSFLNKPPLYWIIVFLVISIVVSIIMRVYLAVKGGVNGASTSQTILGKSIGKMCYGNANCSTNKCVNHFCVL